MWFNLDILYDVLTETGIPTISGGYKGPTVMEIVESADSISIIYTSLHDTLALNNIQKFPTHILIHLQFYYFVGMGGCRIIYEIVLQICYFSIFLLFLYHNIR